MSENVIVQGDLAPFFKAITSSLAQYYDRSASDLTSFLITIRTKVLESPIIPTQIWAIKFYVAEVIMIIPHSNAGEERPT